MGTITIDNQTNLSEREALVELIACLAGFNKKYEFTMDGSVYVLKDKSTQ